MTKLVKKNRKTGLTRKFSQMIGAEKSKGFETVKNNPNNILGHEINLNMSKKYKIKSKVNNTMKLSNPNKKVKDSIKRSTNQRIDQFNGMRDKTNKVGTSSINNEVNKQISPNDVNYVDKIIDVNKHVNVPINMNMVNSNKQLNAKLFINEPLTRNKYLSSNKISMLNTIPKQVKNPPIDDLAISNRRRRAPILNKMERLDVNKLNDINTFSSQMTDNITISSGSNRSRLAADRINSQYMSSVVSEKVSRGKFRTNYRS
jgi:hypothetical protein